MSDGVNTSDSFTLRQTDETFELKINPTSIGAYRYNALFEFGDKSMPSGNDIQTANFKVVETLCDTEIILGGKTFEMRADTQFTQYGLGRYGKDIRVPIAKKQLPVCLEITVEEFSKPVVQNAKVSFYAVNTRPCWFIECLSD